ncbi:precorrin-6y C5,15-methyltransferase (decarboxylating) subunit CbiE [Leptolyngbya sp. FACHB-671]|uniref:precorrin-6y C5,15-methyltransferase (decarboxylating) subunit CbiE n=1 Tax=Leptolyngbya sp. FACHB-671 TaxID=2692812 RepID=UPI0016874C5D|nr:precorrin-6y C5,15-methyltransferase (decarboxylating) subunit CbiE [Leptolyngbya sp. FACHB-671]MBD2067151.1 precorrin-6y C5,15-methyltransferase (decarboxylating) subunit CbiE [Leptolyngbya sp. FACHB-671]
MTPIQVIGIGLDGAAGLPDSVQKLIQQATLLVGSDRHLSYFPHHPAQRLILGDFHQAIATLRTLLPSPSPPPLAPSPSIAVLVSGDPLFFGLGRLLLAELPPDQITFHPHLSSVQLAFSRVKVSWQDAELISAHGRSLEQLTQALQQGKDKIAVLTDPKNTPGAIARLLLALDLPSEYEIWVCENLGGNEERIQTFPANELAEKDFAPLNVVVLLRTDRQKALTLEQLPALGLPDQSFFSFRDRPGLMTKREIRLLVLGELALQPGQVIWDIGAGTGSVSIEIARLFPQSQIYAIEQTAAGTALIQQNCDRFQVKNITSVHGSAPDALHNLPNPDRIFIGGSGGNLSEILDLCAQRIAPKGVLVLALATLERLTTALLWRDQLPQSKRWQHHLLQAQLSRSVPVGSLTRFTPLNPVTLLTLSQTPTE